MAEGRRLARVSVWLPKGDVEYIKSVAESKGVTAGTLLRQAVSSWVKSHRGSGDADQR